MLYGSIPGAFSNKLQIAGNTEQGDLGEHGSKLLHLLEELVSHQGRHCVVGVGGRIGALFFFIQVALQIAEPERTIFHRIEFHTFFLTFIKHRRTSFGCHFFGLPGLFGCGLFTGFQFRLDLLHLRDASFQGIIVQRVPFFHAGLFRKLSQSGFELFGIHFMHSLIPP